MKNKLTIFYVFKMEIQTHPRLRPHQFHFTTITCNCKNHISTAIT